MEQQRSNAFEELIQKTGKFRKFYIEQNIKISADRVTMFVNACPNGHLEVAQWLYQLDPNIDISIGDDFAFRWSCRYGQLHVAQWLVQISNENGRPINISALNEWAFRHACDIGHLEVAQWLLQISPNINISIYNESTFRYACGKGGHLAVAQWLQSLKPYLYVIHYGEDGTYKDYTIRSKEEALWQQRKYLVWLASDQSPNKNSLLYKIPQDVSRYIIQSYL